MSSVGDVVYLNSGGPPMTVTEILPDGSLGVHWVANSELKAATFPAGAVSSDNPQTAIDAASAAASAKESVAQPVQAGLKVGG